VAAVKAKMKAGMRECRLAADWGLMLVALWETRLVGTKESHWVVCLGLKTVAVKEVYLAVLKADLSELSGVARWAVNWAALKVSMKADCSVRVTAATKETRWVESLEMLLAGCLAAGRESTKAALRAFWMAEQSDLAVVAHWVEWSGCRLAVKLALRWAG